MNYSKSRKQKNKYLNQEQEYNNARNNTYVEMIKQQTRLENDWGRPPLATRSKRMDVIIRKNPKLKPTKFKTRSKRNSTSVLPTKGPSYKTITSISTRKYSKMAKRGLTGYLWIEHWLKDLKLDKHLSFFKKHKLYDTLSIYRNFETKNEFSIFLRKNKSMSKNDEALLLEAFQKIILNKPFFENYIKKIRNKGEPIIPIHDWLDRIGLPFLKKKNLFNYKIRNTSDLVKYTIIYSYENLITDINVSTKSNNEKYLEALIVSLNDKISSSEERILKSEFQKLLDKINYFKQSDIAIKHYWSPKEINNWFNNIFLKTPAVIKLKLNKIYIDKLKSLSAFELRDLTYISLMKFLDIQSVDGLTRVKAKIRAIEILDEMKINRLSEELDKLKDSILKIKGVSEDDYKTYRVFFIGGHGFSCPKDKLIGKLYSRKHKQLDRDELKISNYISNLEHQLGKKINADNLTIFTTQSFGRYSPVNLNKFFMSNHIDTDFLYKGLNNMKTYKDLNLLENYVDLDYYKNKFVADKKFDKKFPIGSYEYWKNYSKFNVHEKSLTTKNIVNFMKYHKNNNPENFKIPFEVVTRHDILGIFELTNVNNNIFRKIIQTIRHSNHYNYINPSIYASMGYYIKDTLWAKQNMEDINNILKYNAELHKTLSEQKMKGYRGSFDLKEILRIIYTVGNIKPDEKVLIISNHCRGVVGAQPSKGWNSINTLSRSVKEDVEVIRELSRKKMVNKL